MLPFNMPFCSVQTFSFLKLVDLPQFKSVTSITGKESLFPERAFALNKIFNLYNLSLGSTPALPVMYRSVVT